MSDDIEKLRSRIAAIPYAQAIGFDLSLNADGVLGCLPFATHWVGNPAVPSLHGGALACLLQLTATSQLMMRLGTQRMPKMFGITIQYLSPGRMADTFSRARIMSCGRRFAIAQAIAYQADPECPIASATIQFLLVD